MNCQKATQLLSQAQEQNLAWREKMPLKLHLAWCGACKNFGQQMLFLRQAARTFAKRKDEPN